MATPRVPDREDSQARLCPRTKAYQCACWFYRPDRGTPPCWYMRPRRATCGMSVRSVVGLVVPIRVVADAGSFRTTRAVGALGIGARLFLPPVADGTEVGVMPVAIEQVAHAHIADRHVVTVPRKSRLSGHQSSEPDSGRSG